jgi:biopolymer transport protein TolR
MPKLHTHGTTLAEINIIPLVDVVLVLLIIFMVTAPLLEQGLKVDLPEASAPALDRSENDVYLTIDHKGRIFLQNDDTAYTSMDKLEHKLRAIYKNRDRRVIFIKADKNIRYGYVVKTMGLLHKAGIDRIGMVTIEEKDER